LELAGGTVEAVRGEQVVLAAQQGDPGALRVIVEFGGYLATGLNNLVQLFDPVRIVLGGGLVSAGDLLLGPGLDTYSATRRRGSGLQAVPVVFATFGEGASAYGAAALSLGVVNPRAGTAGCKFMHVQPRAATVPGRKSSYV
jgi:glucokinase